MFTDPQILIFSNFFIKNRSHDTIHTFKNYYATVFFSFSFQFSAGSKRTLNLKFWRFGFSVFSCIQTDTLSLKFWGFGIWFWLSDWKFGLGFGEVWEKIFILGFWGLFQNGYLWVLWAGLCLCAYDGLAVFVLCIVCLVFCVRNWKKRHFRLINACLCESNNTSMCIKIGFK